MSRSSFSIRRFISPRRSQTIDERRHSGDSAASEDLSIFKSRRKQQKSNSWAPSRRLSNAKARRPSREETLVRRTQSTKRVTSEVVTMPEAPPNSSSTSLCSFEGHTDTASVDSGDGALCPPRPQSRTSRSSAPKRLADRRHLCLAPLQTKQNAMPSSSSADADLKDLEFGPLDLAEPPSFKQTFTPPATPEDSGLDRWTLNVQQLIRETDEAFKAVGTAIEDAKVAVSAFPTSPETSLILASPAPSTSRMDSPLPWIKKPTCNNSTPPLPPPARSAAGSSSRPRRKKSKKTKRSKSRSRKGTRWQLGEDVADILSGQFFRKVEVNELLSPDHLRALKAGRDALAQSRISSDTMRTASTDGSETPVEPFHLQDLPSRIGASGVGVSVVPNDTVSPSAVLESSVPQAFLVKEMSPRRKAPAPNVASETRNAAKINEVNVVPPPPAKNPARFASRPQAPPLPTIPEVVITTPDTSISPTDTQTKQTARTFAPVDEDDFVFLEATNYTFNQPTFRHGQIRFPKSDVVKGMKIDPDDTLDWTAFQMAILGGAGDLFSDPSDFSQRSEAEEIADLVEWFSDFGFEHHGLLIPHSTSASPTTTASDYSPMSSVETDINLPIPVAYEHPSGFWNEGNFDTTKFPTQGCGIRRWTMEGHPKRYNNRESIQSLPPSPMMDLVMMRAPDGEPEVVPMGYNLGHDLGDFLRWEAENVYARGVY